MRDGPMRLNIGAGDVRPSGWINVEPHSAGNTDGLIVADPLTGLPFSAGFFDGAVAHHVLMMLTHQEMIPWLTEIRRVMKPGTVLRVTVPDLLSAVDAWGDGDAGWFPIADATARTLDAKFCLYVTQGGATRSVFTATYLDEILEAGGFTERRIVPAGFVLPGTTSGPAWLTDLDSRLDESIVAEARA